MRKELFHMERDVLNIGDSVTIIEGQLPFSYYYTIVPALAMSKNYKNADRIKSREGKVVSKERNCAFSASVKAGIMTSPFVTSAAFVALKTPLLISR